MNRLDVYHGSEPVGFLHDREEGLMFSYAPSWLEAPNAMPLAPGLPLENRDFLGNAVMAFFENLLPEGQVREFLAKSFHLSPENVFGLLARLGGDTAGAYAILPAGTLAGAKAHYLEISREAIHEWLAEKGVPLTLHAPDSRMSLSGAQDKLTVLIDADGKFYLPKGDAPLSHILKPAISYRQDVPHSAVNEAFVMALAGRVGLNVPEVRFDDYLNAAIITRYDRERLPSGEMGRLHQLDFCQLLDMPSSKKYESEGGPSFKQCVDVIRMHSSQPAVDIKRVIEWCAFNVIVGNMDTHAKNLSMLYEGKKVSMSPFYDLVATSVYPNLSRRFAFKPRNLR
ncbi:MAG: type II toxin-antitoxin system HipA family toxin [Sulfuricellaceae bacterium]